ncbi:hypothetical protein CN071_17815 [Sinorhizobium meliloti]|jgi:hypothetical protein|uniref:hypothetical protein n=1 Tax=Rhizobium meliloti TaxID=382 RepID=UPI000D1F3A0C|nr:hypothetical protein [Sinorhizobium meliloti]MDW9787700.1 hypothetical protein [Sinorhizobium meliloti]MDX0056106.1 hypothetical protein [Sinorhizobium meliloti]RMI10467.1 hypothetical protein DA101_003700 [Sinorhizobium meliloti]RVM02614.1 hypothetical protein CN134_34390 [Sinorhizobium meliloti]RVO20706.1 hypothetical protein CN098_34590 [Sinorhizobium meliloti]
MITTTQLRDFAFFLSNTSRWELEKAGIISPGPSGDTAWKRFNNDFDVFVIKLSAEKLTAMTDMIAGYLQVSEYSREQAAAAARNVA